MRSLTKSSMIALALGALGGMVGVASGASPRVVPNRRDDFLPLQADPDAFRYGKKADPFKKRKKTSKAQRKAQRQSASRNGAK